MRDLLTMKKRRARGGSGGTCFVSGEKWMAPLPLRSWTGHTGLAGGIGEMASCPRPHL